MLSICFFDDKTNLFLYIANGLYSSISMSFDELAKVVDMLKDENGIVDDRKYELFSKLSDIFKDDVTCIFKALEAFPPEKHEMIIKTCRDFKQEDYCTVMNFPNLAKFCFDKDGNKIPENIDFIKKIQLLMHLKQKMVKFHL